MSNSGAFQSPSDFSFRPQTFDLDLEGSPYVLASLNLLNYTAAHSIMEPLLFITLGPLSFPVSCQKTRDSVLLALAEVGLGPLFLLSAPIPLAFVRALLTVNNELLVLHSALIGILGSSVASDLRNTPPIDVIFRKIGSSKTSSEPSAAKYAFMTRYQGLSMLGGTEFISRLYDLVGGSETYFAFVVVLVLVHSLTSILTIPYHENYDDEYLLHYRDRMATQAENARQVLDAIDSRKPHGRRSKPPGLALPKNDQKVPRVGWGGPYDALQTPENALFSALPKNGMESPYGLLRHLLDLGRLSHRASSDSVSLNNDHDYDSPLLGSHHSLLMDLLGQYLRKSSHPGLHTSRFGSSSLLAHPIPQHNDVHNSSLSSLLLTPLDVKVPFPNYGVSTPPIHSSGLLDSQSTREPQPSANSTSIWSSSFPDLSQNSKLWDAGTPSKKKPFVAPTTFLVDEETSSPTTRGSPLSERSVDISTGNVSTAFNSAKMPATASLMEKELVLPSADVPEKAPLESPTTYKASVLSSVESKSGIEAKPEIKKVPGLLHNSSLLSISSEDEFYDAHSFSPAKPHTEPKHISDQYLPSLPTKELSSDENPAQKLKILTLTNRRQRKPLTALVPKIADQPPALEAKAPIFPTEPPQSTEYECLEKMLFGELADVSTKTYSIPLCLLADQEDIENEAKKSKEKVKEGVKASKEKEKETPRSKSTVSKKEKLKGIPISKDKVVILPPVKAEPKFPSPPVIGKKPELMVPKKEKTNEKLVETPAPVSKSLNLQKFTDSADLLNGESSLSRSLGGGSDDFQAIIRDLDADLQKLSVRTGRGSSDVPVELGEKNAPSQKVAPSEKKTSLQKNHLQNSSVLNKRSIEKSPAAKPAVPNSYENILSDSVSVEKRLEISPSKASFKSTISQDESSNESDDCNQESSEYQEQQYEAALNEVAIMFPSIPRSDLRARILTASSVEEVIEELFIELDASDRSEKNEFFDRVVAEMSQLRDMFPDLDYGLVDAAYIKHDGDLTLAAESLLSGEYPQEYAAEDLGVPKKKKRLEKALNRLVLMTGIPKEKAANFLDENEGDFYAALVHIVSTSPEPATKTMAQNIKGVPSGGRVQGAYSKAISRTVEVPVGRYKFIPTSDEAQELREIYYSNGQFKRMNEQFFQRALEFFAGDVFKVVEVASALNECKDSELTFEPRFGYVPRLKLGEVSMEEKALSEDDAAQRRNDGILLNLRSSQQYAQMGEEIRKKMAATSDEKLKGYYSSILRDNLASQRSAYAAEGSKEGANRVKEWQRGGSLDLHMLPVSAAMSATTQALSSWWEKELNLRIEDGRLDRFGYEAAFVDPLSIVTGRGIHSRGNNSPIRAAVKAHLEREKYVYDELSGSFTVLGKKEMWK